MVLSLAPSLTLLSSDGTSVSAHAEILALSSPVLADMICVSQQEAAVQGTIPILAVPEPADAWILVLQLLRPGGDISSIMQGLSWESVMTCLQIANKYDIAAIEHQALDTLELLLDDGTSEPAAIKAAQLLQMADEQGYQGLAEASNRAIVRRMQSNIDNGRFLKQLADRLGSSGLKPSIWCAWAAQQLLVPVVQQLYNAKATLQDMLSALRDTESSTAEVQMQFRITSKDLHDCQIELRRTQLQLTAAQEAHEQLQEVQEVINRVGIACPKCHRVFYRYTSLRQHRSATGHWK